MSVIEKMIERAKRSPRHIILAEGTDPRIISGAVKAVGTGVATITLLGDSAEIRPLTHAAGDTGDAINILNPGIVPELDFANQIVKAGVADGSVSGAIHTTGDVIRSALRVIGVRPGNNLVSSLFIMVMPEGSKHLRGAVVYSDCGVVADPNAEQLGAIASESANSAEMFLKIDPKIAMLSFATGDSAQHELVEKVRSATAKLKQARPDLTVDGPVQFDAAIMPEISKVKTPESSIHGQANIFIFPNLDAGNIGYKITERIGGAVAIGPILQGLAKPANDLSRGCSADDVYKMIVVTVLQAQNQS